MHITIKPSDEVINKKLKMLKMMFGEVEFVGDECRLLKAEKEGKVITIAGAEVCDITEFNEIKTRFIDDYIIIKATTQDKDRVMKSMSRVYKQFIGNKAVGVANSQYYIVTPDNKKVKLEDKMMVVDTFGMYDIKTGLTLDENKARTKVIAYLRKFDGAGGLTKCMIGQVDGNTEVKKCDIAATINGYFIVYGKYSISVDKIINLDIFDTEKGKAIYHNDISSICCMEHMVDNKLDCLYLATLRDGVYELLRVTEKGVGKIGVKSWSKLYNTIEIIVDDNNKMIFKIIEDDSNLCKVIDEK